MSAVSRFELDLHSHPQTIAPSNPGLLTTVQEDQVAENESNYTLQMLKPLLEEFCTDVSRTTGLRLETYVTDRSSQYKPIDQEKIIPYFHAILKESNANRVALPAPQDAVGQIQQKLQSPHFSTHDKAEVILARVAPFNGIRHQSWAPYAEISTRGPLADDDEKEFNALFEEDLRINNTMTLSQPNPNLWVVRMYPPRQYHNSTADKFEAVLHFVARSIGQSSKPTTLSKPENNVINFRTQGFLPFAKKAA